MDFSSCTQNGILTFNCVKPLIQGAINIGLGLAGTVALFFIISAGITFITSGGGKQVEAAKNTLTYAIIGLIIILFSFLIVNVIGRISGVTCFFSGSCS